MEQLIPVINDLQDIAKSLGENIIDLPQIVVIGNQSSGKSSLIENIVGKEFLPRGTGIVTRRPLILQLLNIPPNDTNLRKVEDGTDFLDEWARFEHDRQNIFVDFDKVRDEIEAETNRLTGNNKGISSQPITLKIFSKHVITLTLVDLPGMTKIAVGDQPEDIEIQIREIIMKYITNPKAIILAVTAANTDIATSEALKLAKKVDPTGERTISVLTKLDLMDAGCDATQLLQGNIIQIKKGIIGIVNRSQKDINEKKTIEEALKFEAEFLRTNYPALYQRNGTLYLRKTLNSMLMNHIKENLPRLKNEVSSQLTTHKTFYAQFGEEISNKNKKILEIIYSFTEKFKNLVDGDSLKMNAIELCGGARIRYIFQEIFGKTLESIQPLTGLEDQAILASIQNARGLGASSGLEKSFEILVKQQIAKLEEPSLKCVELVYEELVTINKKCIDKSIEITRFQNLIDKISETFTNLLNEKLDPTINMIKDLIKIELAFIDKSGFCFVESETPRSEIAKPDLKITNMNDKRKEMFNLMKASGDDSQLETKKSIDAINHDFEHKKLSPHDEKCLALIQKYITNYFIKIKLKLKDSVPKAIVHFLINSIKDELNTTLITELHSKADLEELFKESDTVINKRKEIGQKIEYLTKAIEIINRVRGF